MRLNILINFCILFFSLSAIAEDSNYEIYRPNYREAEELLKLAKPHLRKVKISSMNNTIVISGDVDAISSVMKMFHELDKKQIRFSLKFRRKKAEMLRVEKISMQLKRGSGKANANYSQSRATKISQGVYSVEIIEGKEGELELDGARFIFKPTLLDKLIQIDIKYLGSKDGAHESGRSTIKVPNRKWNSISGAITRSAQHDQSFLSQKNLDGTTKFTFEVFAQAN